MIVAQPSRCAHRAVRRLPSTRMTAAPSAGSAMITHSNENTPLAADGSTTGTDSRRGTSMSSGSLVLQQARVVDRGRAAGAEDRHDDREADHHLGGGDHHHEERGDLAVEVAVHAGEGDQRQVRGVQHQLHAHEHHDRVAPGQHPNAADREQDRRQHQEGCRAHDRSSPSWWASWWASWWGSWWLSGWALGSPSIGPRGPECVTARFDVPSPIESVSRSTSVAGAVRTAPRALSTRDTEDSRVVPSGRSAGVSTALCRAKTPGDGSGPRWVPFEA